MVRREEGHFRYFELTGTITGIGWGGYAEPNAQPWGQPHDPADVWLPFPNGLALLDSLYGFSIASHGRLAPVVARLIDSMVSHLRAGAPLIPSWIDGHIAQGSIYGMPGTVIEFNQYDRRPGSAPSTATTSLVPSSRTPVWTSSSRSR